MWFYDHVGHTLLKDIWKLATPRDKDILVTVTIYSWLQQCKPPGYRYGKTGIVLFLIKGAQLDRSNINRYVYLVIEKLSENFKHHKCGMPTN